jgi:hypothetical protein
MKTRVAFRLQVSQTSFYCTVFAAATHFALSRVGTEASNANLMLRLDYKDRALKMIMGNVNAFGQDMPDEILHAIFSLASYSTAERISPLTSREMKNPLVTGFDLDVYSRIPAEYAHIRALSHLIRERGGLPGMKRPGFAVVVSLYLTSSNRTLTCANKAQLRYFHVIPKTATARIPPAAPDISLRR